MRDIISCEKPFQGPKVVCSARVGQAAPFLAAVVGAVWVSSGNSLGNSFVHSLLVTLGNHAIPPFQPYNCPCPNGHVSLQQFGRVRLDWGPALPRSG